MIKNIINIWNDYVNFDNSPIKYIETANTYFDFLRADIIVSEICESADLLELLTRLNDYREFDIFSLTGLQ